MTAETAPAECPALGSASIMFPSLRQISMRLWRSTVTCSRCALCLKHLRIPTMDVMP